MDRRQRRPTGRPAPPSRLGDVEPAGIAWRVDPEQLERHDRSVALLNVRDDDVRVKDLRARKRRIQIPKANFERALAHLVAKAAGDEPLRIVGPEDGDLAPWSDDTEQLRKAGLATPLGVSPERRRGHRQLDR